MYHYRRQSSVTKPLVSEATPSNSQDSDKTNTEKKVVLNIWDFSGQSIYYTTHQVSVNQYTHMNTLLCQLVHLFKV